MDNEPANAPQEKRKSRTSKMLFMVIPAIAILLLVGGLYYYFQAKTTTKHVLSRATTKSQQVAAPLMRPQTPAPLRDIQKKQLAEGTSTTTNKKLFEVTGGNFYFTPNKITVNQGDKVTIIFFNRFGTHDFMIDALHVRTPQAPPGLPVVATFTAAKKGTYEFYSNYPQDRDRGMKGTLIVQ